MVVKVASLLILASWATTRVFRFVEWCSVGFCFGGLVVLLLVWGLGWPSRLFCDFLGFSWVVWVLVGG